MVWMLAGVVLLCWLGLRLRAGPPRPWLHDVLLGETPAAPALGAWSRLWDSLGVLLLVGAFAGLEWAQPYYFAQDDTLIVELPGMLAGCRGVWEGHFPEYDPRRLLGAPLAGMGMYSLTYPPTYVAYAIARHGLWDEFALMEVFAALHLAAGYGLTRLLGRRLGLGPVPAVLAALSFGLSGAMLVGGRSWHAVIPLWALLPAAGLCVARLSRGPVGGKWAAAAGGTVAAAWHVGFPQYAAFLGGFALLACAAQAGGGAVPAGRLRWLVPALLLAGGLSAPLAWTQFDASRQLERQPLPNFGASPLEVVVASVLPYPVVSVPHPANFGSAHLERMGVVYFSGGLLSALFLARLALVPAAKLGSPLLDPWTLCGLLAFWLLLGEGGGLWAVLERVPVLGTIVRMPSRMLPFLAFFSAIVGAGVLDRALRRAPAWATPAAGALGLGLVAFHVAQCRPSHYTYGFAPYPPLPAWAEPLKSSVTEFRGIAWAGARSGEADWAEALGSQLPSAYGLTFLHGYDPVVEGLPPYRAALAHLRQTPREALRAYGARWHVVHRTAESPDRGPNPAWRDWEAMVLPRDVFAGASPGALPLVGESAAVSLRELSGCDPLAFARAQPGRPLPVSLHAGGVDADVSGLPAGSGVVLNFLRYPGTSVALDGGALAAGSDGWGRVAVTLPAAGSRLAMRHRAPWGPGLALGGGLLLAALLTAGALRWVWR